MSIESFESSAARQLDSALMKRKLPPVNWVQAAVELAGGVAVVADAFGVSRQTIYDWINLGTMKDLRGERSKVLAQLSGLPIQKLLE